MPLQVLPPEVAAKIAAGEVIERPASAVKELVENALDAGATAIWVDIVEGGRGLIRVRDNGVGLPSEQLALAFQRHATSKIASEADLLYVSTLGFRGEALPSIASVADVTFLSRQHNAVGGAYVRFKDDKQAGHGPQGAPEGTTVAIRDLFLNFPARRKFLRSDTTEAGHCVTIVTHYALARPAVSFSMTVEGKRVLQTPGDGELRNAAAAVLGTEAAAALVKVLPPDEPAQSSDIEVTGLVSPPGLTRSSRAHQSLYVNGRWVQHRALAHAVEEAYQNALMVGRHPISILHVTVPSQEVDVNIHPRKTEVRFRNEGEVYRSVQRAVRHTIAASAPGGQQAPTPAPALAPALTSTEAAAPAQATLFTPPTAPQAQEEAAATSATRPWPLLRVVGQMNGTYIITEGPDGMYLIDQHAAHERVVFEQVAHQAEEHGWDSQGLIEPHLVTMPLDDLHLVLEDSSQLQRYGFALESFGERQLLVRALPRGLRLAEVSDVVRELLDSLHNGQDRFNGVLATVACHSAVRAGDSLAPAEMQALLQDLERCQQPQTCPHGRPTMIHVSSAHLEREFGRRG